MTGSEVSRKISSGSQYTAELAFTAIPANVKVAPFPIGEFHMEIFENGHRITSLTLGGDVTWNVNGEGNSVTGFAVGTGNVGCEDGFVGLTVGLLGGEGLTVDVGDAVEDVVGAYALPMRGAHDCFGAPPPTPNVPFEAATVSYTAAFQLVTTDSLLKIVRTSLVHLFSF